MLIDTMTSPHTNFCTSDTFWPVSPSGLQLQQPSIATFITTRFFLLWEVNTLSDLHVPKPASYRQLTSPAPNLCLTQAHNIFFHR